MSAGPEIRAPGGGSRITARSPSRSTQYVNPLWPVVTIPPVPADDPGIRTENVHRAIFLERRDHQRVHVSFLPDVATHAHAADPGGHRIRIGFVEIGAYHAARAFLGETHGKRLADAAGGTCDDDYFVFDFHEAIVPYFIQFGL